MIEPSEPNTRKLLLLVWSIYDDAIHVVDIAIVSVAIEVSLRSATTSHA